MIYLCVLVVKFSYKSSLSNSGAIVDGVSESDFFEVNEKNPPCVISPANISNEYTV